MAEVDPKILDGLKFRYSEENVVEEDGRKIKKFMPKERDMRPDDVLSSRDYGDSVVIVTADGQKITIPKYKSKKKGE